jgi:hypothetical protein
MDKKETESYMTTVQELISSGSVAPHFLLKSFPEIPSYVVVPAVLTSGVLKAIDLHPYLMEITDFLSKKNRAVGDLPYRFVRRVRVYLENPTSENLHEIIDLIPDVSEMKREGEDLPVLAMAKSLSLMVAASAKYEALDEWDSRCDEEEISEKDRSTFAQVKVSENYDWQRAVLAQSIEQYLN